MNEEQLAALREAAQLDPAKVFAGEDVLPILTALADGHLEIAEQGRKTSERGQLLWWEAVSISNQMAEWRTDYWLARERLRNYGLTIVNLEAEVARLTEERAEARAQFAELQQIGNERYNNQIEEQREDIRRLVEALSEISAGRMSNTGEGDVAMPRAVMMSIAEEILAEMKERYA